MSDKDAEGNKSSGSECATCNKRYSSLTSHYYQNPAHKPQSWPECPTCGERFANETYVKSHHKAKHDEKISGFEHECGWCGDLFTHKSSEAKYCSRECFGKAHSESMSGESHPQWKGGEIELECEWCGDTFKVPQSKSDRKYCSQECSGKAMMDQIPQEKNPFYNGGAREQTKCKQCGNSFEFWEVQNRKFCSTKCFDEWQRQSGHLTGENNPNYNGGSIVYGPGWNFKKKEKVRERDNRQCKGCGMDEEKHKEIYGERLSVHHIQKAKSFDNPQKRNSMDNLVSLCNSCHFEWEKMAPLKPQKQ